MAISISAGYSFGATEQVTATKLGTLITNSVISGIAESDVSFDGTTVALLAGAQTIAGDKTFSGTSIFSGDVTLSGTNTISGDTTHSGGFTVTGTLTADGGTIYKTGFSDVLTHESEVLVCDDDVLTWEE